MAKSFEKFNKKILSEEPIIIGKPATKNQNTEVKATENTVAEAVKQEAAVAPAEPATKKERKVSKASRGEGVKLVTVTMQLDEATKDMLDELKFTQKKKMWELASEAINDLYAKYKK